MLAAGNMNFTKHHQLTFVGVDDEGVGCVLQRGPAPQLWGLVTKVMVPRRNCVLLSPLTMHR